AMTWIFTLAIPSSTSAAMPASIQASRVMRPAACFPADAFALGGRVALTMSPPGRPVRHPMDGRHVEQGMRDIKFGTRIHPDIVRGRCRVATALEALPAFVCRWTVQRQNFF